MRRFFRRATAAHSLGNAKAEAAGSSNHGWKDRLDLRAGIAAFSLLAMMINTAAVIRMGRSEERATIEQAVAQNSRLAAEFEQVTMRTLANAEAAARSIARQYLRDGADTPLATMRAEGTIDGAFFTAVSVADKNGGLVVSSDTAQEIARGDAARLEALKFHAGRETSKLFVGTPRHSPASGETLVPLSLRRNNADGSFGGFVLLELDPARFTDFARSTVDHEETLMLVGLDGIARARRSGGVSTAGQDFRRSSLFADLERGRVGNDVSISPVDGVRRLFSFRQMEDYPLVVAAAVSEEKALAVVAQRRHGYYTRAVVLTAIIALLSWGMISALSRRARAMALLRTSRDALHAREQEFRTVTESMPQLVWIAEADGRHRYFNQQWLDYTGLSLEQSVGDGWTAAYDPAERAEVLKLWRETVARDELYEANNRVRGADGNYRWMLTRALPLRDEGGRTTQWFGTSTDINNQVEAQEQVREQADLLNLTQDAIIVRDGDETIRFRNQGAERLYGWKAEEVIGKDPREFAYSDLAPVLAAKKILAETGQWAGEMDHLRKDGSTVRVNSRWTAVPNESGLAPSVLAINTDITEQKRLEAQLLRTQRLESIGTLASGVAHDLNNILAPIMMAAPLLRDEMAEDKRDQLVSLLEQCAERGAAIVRQVLTFARGADGERVLLQPVYALKEIGEIAAETFPKSINIRTVFPEDLWLIEADPTQLHQVLLNLCVNARDAMPDGGTLSLSATNFDLDEHYAAMTAGAKVGPHLLLTVADTGTGIPAEVLDKIFDPFFTTKGVGVGTGLGLSTVLGIVQDYEGTINVESTPHGTTFRILLPAAPSSLMIDQRAEEKLPDGHGETILVVDDELAIRAVAERLLRKHGYRVLLAEDGPAALSIFAAHGPEIDLSLTDLAMPMMNGVALARTLRKMKPDARIIISAGHEDDCNPAEMAEIGIAATLPKPYTQATLLRLLDQVIYPNRK